MASGINNTFRQVGIATGIAGLGAVFQHDVTHNHDRRAGPAGRAAKSFTPRTAKLATALVSGEVGQVARGLPPQREPRLMHAYRVGFTEAFTSILIIAACVALAGSACAFALVRSRDFVHRRAPGGGPPASRASHSRAPRAETAARRRAAHARDGRAVRATERCRSARGPSSQRPAVVADHGSLSSYPSQRKQHRQRG